ncbi:MAG: site-specific integrase [Lachnospiraceae bacterium]|nr:site-specific integrase [Lachnospiraceae bacterium]
MERTLRDYESAYAILKKDGSDLTEMSNRLIGLYQQALEGNHYTTPFKLGDGRWKSRALGVPIVKTDKLDVYRALYKLFFGKTLNESVDPTVEEVYVQWLASFNLLVDQGHRSPDTLKKYKSDWRFFADHDIRNRHITKIKRSELKSFLEQCASNQAINRKVLQNLKSLVNHIWSFARDDLDLDVIDVRRISTRTIICDGDDDLGNEAYYSSVYTSEERDLIIKEAQKDLRSVYNRAIVFLFCVCMRIGELCALSWQDVNFSERTVFIHRSMRRRRIDGKNILVRLAQTKNRKQSGNRTQLLSDTAMEMLRRQRLETAFDDYIFMSKWHGERRPISADEFNNRLKKICKACGVRYLSSHKMRFFAITALAKAAVPVAEIQRIAGHQSMGMTLHYICPERETAVDEDDWNDIFS